MSVRELFFMAEEDSQSNIGVADGQEDAVRSDKQPAASKKFIPLSGKPQIVRLGESFLGGRVLIVNVTVGGEPLNNGIKVYKDSEIIFTGRGLDNLDFWEVSREGRDSLPFTRFRTKSPSLAVFSPQDALGALENGESFGISFFSSKYGGTMRTLSALFTYETEEADEEAARKAKAARAAAEAAQSEGGGGTLGISQLIDESIGGVANAVGRGLRSSARSAVSGTAGAYAAGSQTVSQKSTTESAGGGGYDEETAQVSTVNVPSSTIEASSAGTRVVSQSGTVGGSRGAEITSSGTVSGSGGGTISSSGTVEPRTRVGATAQVSSASGGGQTFGGGTVSAGGTASAQAFVEARVSGSASGQASGGGQVSASVSGGGGVSSGGGGNISGQASVQSGGSQAASARPVSQGLQGGGISSGRQQTAQAQSAGQNAGQQAQTVSQNQGGRAGSTISGTAQTAVPSFSSGTNLKTQIGGAGATSPAVPKSRPLASGAPATPLGSLPQNFSGASGTFQPGLNLGASTPVDGIAVNPPAGMEGTLNKFFENQSALGRLDLGPAENQNHEIQGQESSLPDGENVTESSGSPASDGQPEISGSPETEPDVAPPLSEAGLPGEGAGGEGQGGQEGAVDSGDSGSGAQSGNSEPGAKGGLNGQTEGGQGGPPDKNAPTGTKPPGQNPEATGAPDAAVPGQQPAAEGAAPDSAEADALAGPEADGEAGAGAGPEGAAAAGAALSGGGLDAAAALVNTEVNSLLTAAALWVWGSGIVSCGFTIVLGALVGDFLVLMKKRLAKRAVSALSVTSLGAGMKLASFSNDQLAEKIKFNLPVKANIAAMNAVVAVMIFGAIFFFGVVLYAGCTWPLGQFISSATNFKASIIGGMGYSNVCQDFLSFPAGLSGAAQGATTAGPGAPSPSTSSSRTCNVLPSGNASVAQLSTTCFGANAYTAAVVAAHESGGTPGIASGTDYCRNPDGSPVMINGKIASVSFGLFQINITAHPLGNLNCPTAFSNLYTGSNKQCQITNPNLYNQCVAAAEDPQQNIQAACQISNNGTKWSAWQADINACNINPGS